MMIYDPLIHEIRQPSFDKDNQNFVNFVDKIVNLKELGKVKNEIDSNRKNFDRMEFDK